MITTNDSGGGLSNSKPTILDLAREYIERGWAVIPIPRGRKTPVLKEWPKLRITEADLHEYFNGQPKSIGVILGTPSGNLIDIDLDCPEAVSLAPHFLPDTLAIFGRASKVRSHYLYYSEIRQAKYKAPDGKMLLELRSDGAQRSSQVPVIAVRLFNGLMKARRLALLQRISLRLSEGWRHVHC